MAKAAQQATSPVRQGPSRARARGASLGAGLAALGSGALLALAFPAPSQWWLALVALAPPLALAAAARSGARAAGTAWVAGVGFFLAIHLWLWESTRGFVIGLALLLALSWAPAGWLAWRLRGRSPLLAMLLLPSAFVLGEVARAWQGLGGPWGLLGTSQWNAPLLQVASLGGVWLLSFLVVAVNVGVAAALAPGAPARRRLVAAGATGILLLGAVAYGLARPPPPPAGTARVAMVQPGIVHDVEARFAASERHTHTLTGQRLDVVVWGESSVGRDPSANPADVRRLTALARATGAPLLVNVDARRAGSEGIYKSALLVGPDGRRGSYDKMRLVPFGEYIPLRPVFGWVTRFTDAADVDRHRGDHQVVLHAGDLALGPLICFESAFPDMGRHLANAGAEVIVVQTATTTFQQSWAPAQHASLAAVRAVESGRPVVQAAISGVSTAFDARGRQLAWYGTGYQGTAVVEVPLGRELTPYDRFGDWAPALAALALVVAALVSLRRRRARGTE